MNNNFIINRDKYLEFLLNYKDDNRVKVITGPRRSGKSFLLHDIFIPILKRDKSNNIIYIDLDMQTNYHNPAILNECVLDLINHKKKNYIIIDEIQKVHAIINPTFTNGEYILTKPENKLAITFVDIVLGWSKLENVSVFVTGSNSKMLSKDIDTSFRGKSVEINLNPPSFLEYRTYDNGDLTRAFINFNSLGSMPEMLKEKDNNAKEKYLKSLISLTYTQDIVDRLNLHNDKALSETLKILADCVGQYINSNNIANTYKSITNISISKNTIESYIKALLDSYIIQEVYRYDIKGKHHIGALRKYYFKDIGFRNAILNFSKNDSSGVLENIVFNELIYRGLNVMTGILPIYEKNKNGNPVRKLLEVDFIAFQGSKKYYIQVSKSINDDKTKDREIKSLKNINDSYKKIVITQDEILTKTNEDGIVFINIKDFLDNINSLDSI